MSAFAGFPPDAWAFLTELEADNTKRFFDTNRQRYANGVAGPSKALVEALAVVLPNRLDIAVRAEANACSKESAGPPCHTGTRGP